MKRKILITVIALIAIFLLTSCGENTLNDTANIVPSVTENYMDEGSSIENQEINRYAGVDKFIELYNAKAVTPITDSYEIDINDTNGEYYRTEFRLNAFKNAPSKCGKIGDSTIEMIHSNYESTFGADFRIYVKLDSNKDGKEIVGVIASIFDPDITQEELQEFYDSYDEGFTSSFVLGDITGTYPQSGEIMMDVSRPEFLNK